MEPNDDAQSKEDLDDDGDGDDIHGDDPIRGLDMLLWRHLCFFKLFKCFNFEHLCMIVKL